MRAGALMAGVTSFCSIASASLWSGKAGELIERVEISGYGANV